MTTIQYLRIYADANGCSHLEEKLLELETNDYAPPAPSLYTSLPISAEKCVFLELPVGWYGVWHPTPVRQWMVFMSGEVGVEAGDGEQRILKAGDVLMLEDTHGKGHLSKVNGDTPVRIAAFHIPELEESS